MPAAKMEKPGRKAPVTSNRSPSGWDYSNHDLLVNDPEEREDISARLVRFDQLFSSISRADVISHHSESYLDEHNRPASRKPQPAAGFSLRHSLPAWFEHDPSWGA